MALVTELDLPHIDIFGERFTADPHAAFRAARQQHWLARSEVGYHVLTYDASQALLRDKRFRFGAEQGLPAEGAAREALLERSRRNLLNLAGADHTRLRRLVTKAFTPRAVERMRPHVRRVIDGLLDPVCARGRCEFVHDVSEPYPVMVICEVLGTPIEDWRRFSDWVEILFSRLGLALDEESTVAVLTAQLELDRYLTELVERRRQAGGNASGDDLLGELVAVEEDGDHLATAELVVLMDNILSAGTDTTRNELASAVALFAAHPDQLAHLAEDRSLLESAVEEVLRFAPVVAGTLRVATEEVEIDGVVFAEGTMVTPTMAAANRDPAVYPDPDRFDITRTQPQGHLSFGGGAHYCLGAALARLELVESFDAVVERLPGLRADGDVRWKSPVGIGGPEVLPIAFDAGH
ncbi:MAG: cytochrome P450 [Actinomycetota bacterium]|nr:cytochrome P450 [Actinomycetota bacterium]